MEWGSGLEAGFGSGERCGAAQDLREVAVCDMDAGENVLVGVDGRSFREVETNVWVSDQGERSVAYLGTGRHGGGIVLRPLFVRRAGVWLNVSTGREAPCAVNLPSDG